MNKKTTTRNNNKYKKFIFFLDEKQNSKNTNNENMVVPKIDDLSKPSDSASASASTSLQKENIDKFIKTINEIYDLNYDDKYFMPCHNVILDPNIYSDDVIGEKIVYKPILNIIKKLYGYKKKRGNTATDLININDSIDKLIIKLLEKNIVKKKITIDVDINNLEGLIKLINDYPLDDKIEYNINMAALHKIKLPLEEMNNMIGMKGLKENIVDQILYFIQDLHKTNDKHHGDFMHTVIYGPPGTGKTDMAKIIGKIYSNLGILTKGTFKKVTRSDLIAGYLGQTAIKTRDVITECIGGVLFIDEAYALGNTEKKDIFSKECIDTLCEALSNHKHELMVIIAGYEKELKECFFSYNQGLDSRFTWRFKTDQYNGLELYNIFLKKVHECNWSIDTDLLRLPPTEIHRSPSPFATLKASDRSKTTITAEWFEKNVVYFKFFGRDIETLLSKTKISHSRRVFCKPIESKTKITLKDLEKGFESFLKNDEVKNRQESESINKMVCSMYV